MVHDDHDAAEIGLDGASGIGLAPWSATIRVSHGSARAARAPLFTAPELSAPRSRWCSHHRHRGSFLGR
jgi:hypothetical protein